MEFKLYTIIWYNLVAFLNFFLKGKLPSEFDYLDTICVSHDESMVGQMQLVILLIWTFCFHKLMNFKFMNYECQFVYFYLFLAKFNRKNQ